MRRTSHSSRVHGFPGYLLYRLIGLLLAALLVACANDQLHRQGLDALNAGRIEEGLAALDQAARESPQNLRYRADYISARDRVLRDLIALGEREKAAGRNAEAAAYFKRVLALDAGNARARAGLEAIAAAERHEAIVKEAQALFDQGELEQAQAKLQPVLLENPEHAAANALHRQIEDRLALAAMAQPALTSKFKRPLSLQFRDANLKQVFEALSRASGINVLLDKDVRGDLKTTIFVRDASVEDSIDMILMQNQLEKKILNDNTVFVYPNTPAKTKDYQDLVIRSFHLTNADAKEMLNLVKTMLKTKDIFINEKTNSLVMRDTPEAVRLAEKLLAAQDLNQPEVMLEVEVLEVQRSKATELGIAWPNSVGFSVTGIPATTTVNNLPGGGVVTTTTPAQDLNLQSLQNLTASAIKVTPLSATVNLRKEVGDSNILASPRIRVSQHEKAKIMIGDRVPVITNSVTPVSTGTPVVTGQVQYLDVGLKLEVEPEIHLDGEVAIKTFLEVSSIANQVTNPNSGTVAYQIGTRNASTVLRLKDGETQVLAGLISDADRKSASKIPGLGDLPILGRLFSSHKDDASKSEIILSITPHIVRNIHRPDAELTEFWSGTDGTLRTKPLTLQPVGQIRTGATTPMAQTPARPLAAVKPPVTAPAAPPLMLSWQGPAQAKVGDQFRLALNVQSNASVNSLPLQIGYDASALQVVDVAEGDFFKQGNAQTAFTPEVDAANGRIRLAASVAGEGRTGRDSLAVITFRAIAPKSPAQVSATAGEPPGATTPPPYAVTITP